MTMIISATMTPAKVPIDTEELGCWVAVGVVWVEETG